MRNSVSALLYSVAGIFGAHSLAFLLVSVLPQAAVAALGILSSNKELLSAFSQVNPSRTYFATLSGFLVGDLGRTLDGQPVTIELMQALGESAPRVGASIFLLAGGCIATAMWVKEEERLLWATSDFIAFLPPFVAPFLGLAAILGIEISTGAALPDAVYEIIAVMALSLGGGALLVSQAARITQRNLRSEFVRSIRAAGAGYWQTRIRILHNLTAEISPTFEKLVVGLAASLFFVEPILGLGGFGTLAARAVRRSDIDLLLGITLVVASLVAVCRLSVLVVREAYGITES